MSERTFVRLRGPGMLSAAFLLLLVAACGQDDAPDGEKRDLIAALATSGEIARGAKFDDVLDALATATATSGDLPAITVDYPLEGSIFPPEIVAPMMLWHDESAATSAWYVDIDFADGSGMGFLVPGVAPPEGVLDPDAVGATIYEPTPYQASARSWTPSSDLWETIKRRSMGVAASITLYGFAVEDPSRSLSRGRVSFSTSNDPVGAPIFYRDVPLMPSSGRVGRIQPLAGTAVPLIGWRLRDIALPESRLVMTGMPTCANCHSFALDGKTLAMDVDGPQGDKGSYMIAPIEANMVVTYDEVITWNAFKDKPEGHTTIGFLSRVSPDSAYVVTTLNEDLYVANFMDYRFCQVFYPTGGILAWYSRETEEMKALPGADDPTYVHCGPTWYPDGQSLVFARAASFEANPPNQVPAEFANDPKEPQIQYDLYRIPFDGGKGGTPKPIQGASANGASNTFPKVSPDGKWLVWTQCRNGLLMRPDGRLWIIPAEGGVAREMRCNTSLMNSWHSFSPNSRWMVFSSKSNTPYTQMFLTHIDEDGNDSPPILIPNSTAANRAVNIPEFMNAAYGALLSIEVPAVNHYHLYQKGKELVTARKFAEALVFLEQAVELDPDFSRAHVNLAYCLNHVGRREEARRHYERAIEIDPKDLMARNGLAAIFSDLGSLDEALVQLRAAFALAPELLTTRRNLGLLLAGMGRATEAIVHLRFVLREAPRDIALRRALVTSLLNSGRADLALRQLEAIIDLDPDDVEARTMWAGVLATHPDPRLRDGAKAVALAEEACRRTNREHPEPLDALAAAYAEAGRFDEAVAVASEALSKARNPDLVRLLKERLELYRQRKPFRTR